MMGGKWHKITILSLLAAAAAAVVYFKVVRKEEPPDHMEASGIIEATEVELASKIPGRIEWLCCVEGDAVKAGAPAIRLENREYSARVEEGRAAVAAASQSLNEAGVSIENARVQAESSKYDLESATSEVDRIAALTEDSRTNLERSKGLYKDGFLPKKDLDAAQASYDANSASLSSAMARKRSAGANLRNASINIKAAQARIASAAARKAQAEAELKVIMAQLEDTDIRSPIDGAVVYKFFEKGETLNPGAAVYTVDDLNNIWARVDIEETDIHRIKLGDRAEVRTMSVPPAVFDGSVIEIGDVGEFAARKDVTRGRPDIKTFRVKAGVSNPGGKLKPRMTVSVRIYYGKGRR